MAFAVLALLSIVSGGAFAADEDTVVLLQVEGEVNAAMTSYIEDAIAQAEASGSAVVLMLDTYGGQVIEADSIKKAIMGAAVPVDCYIIDEALSAGVLISIACERIVMAPGAVIGAAETIPNDEKTLATWVGILEATAQARGRDEKLVAAMADKSIEIEGVTQRGELLALSANEADALGFSDGTADTATQALDLLGYGSAAATEQGMSFPVRAAQFLTSTTVTSLLFLAAIICMGIEVFTAGFGIFGILSIVFFGLYFGGGFLAGFAQWWSILLFFVGIVLFIIEAVVPGFGIFGILGIAAVVAGVLFASRDFEAFLITVGVGLVGAIIALPLLFRLFKKMGLIRKFTLPDNMDVEAGYVSHEHISDMVGKRGVALTVLRPAGTAKIDGVRYNVLTSGAYIEKGAAIVVVSQTPGRIVVDTADE